MVDLLQPRPGIATEDRLDRGFRDTVLAGESRFLPSGSRERCSDGSDIVLGELALGVLVRPVSEVTAPPVHVTDVVGPVSEIQMRGVAAWWIVTVMQNPEPVRDWAVMDLPRDTVSTIVPAVVSSYVAVPKRVGGSSPEPALVRTTDIDLLPESSFETFTSKTISVINISVPKKTAVMHWAQPSNLRLAITVAYRALGLSLAKLQPIVARAQTSRSDCARTSLGTAHAGDHSSRGGAK